MLGHRAVHLTAPTAEPFLPSATPLEPTLMGMLQVFINTYEKRRRKGRKRARFAQSWCNISPFRINTSKSVSKQTTLTPFRMNTYEKTGGWGGSPQTVNNPRAPRLRVTFSRPYLVTSLHPYFVASRRCPASCYTVPPMALQPLGQHFLAELHWREEIARAIRVSPHSTVPLSREDQHCWIEIGA